MKSTILFILGIVIFTTACNDDTGEIKEGIWDIPQDQVFDGGPGKDGIPSVDNPQFGSLADMDPLLGDNDLVIGFAVDGEIRAYPHIVLDWHEIVNDNFPNTSVAITYCPLTGTAIGWNRIIDGQETTFGVSGLLYNSNLIPYDRKTDSNWSQIGLECVNGDLRGETIQTHQVIETTWKTWKTLFPTAQVLTTNTQISRNYGTYPYGDYITNHNLTYFPINPLDERLNSKDRVLGIVKNDKAKVYQFDNFENGIGIIEDNFEGIDLIIVGDFAQNFMVAYENRLSDGTVLNFTPIQNDNTAIIEDQEGNQWNIFGIAVSGARTGERLLSTNSFMGYWFSFPAFYETEIYE